MDEKWMILLQRIAVIAVLVVLGWYFSFLLRSLP